jgi:hypothetical protein
MQNFVAFSSEAEHVMLSTAYGIETFSRLTVSSDNLIITFQSILTCRASRRDSVPRWCGCNPEKAFM